METFPFRQPPLLVNHQATRNKEVQSERCSAQTSCSSPAGPWWRATLPRAHLPGLSCSGSQPAPFRRTLPWPTAKGASGRFAGGIKDGVSAVISPSPSSIRHHRCQCDSRVDLSCITPGLGCNHGLERRRAVIPGESFQGSRSRGCGLGCPFRSAWK